MRARIGLLAIVAALVAVVPARTALTQEVSSHEASSHEALTRGIGPALTVRYAGAPLVPGSVGVLVVRGSQALTAIEGTAFDRPVHFWPVGAGQWHGLVGAGLDTPAGTFVVDVRGAGPDGEVLAVQTTVVVAAKQFETRRLRVAQKFATPPAEEAERIQRDARLLATVFATTTDRLWSGPFVAPVGGRATSSFGRLTLLNGRPNGRHQGADFRAATGATVTAPNAGRVALASELYFAGNTVILDHGLGLFSLFAHLSAIDVAVGDLVARGDRLGEAGATGRVTGPHLHWAVRLGSLSVDPLALMAVTGDLPESNDILSTR